MFFVVFISVFLLFSPVVFVVLPVVLSSGCFHQCFLLFSPVVVVVLTSVFHQWLFLFSPVVVVVLTSGFHQWLLLFSPVVVVVLTSGCCCFPDGAVCWLPVLQRIPDPQDRDRSRPEAVHA